MGQIKNIKLHIVTDIKFPEIKNGRKRRQSRTTNNPCLCVHMPRYDNSLDAVWLHERLLLQFRWTIHYDCLHRYSGEWSETTETATTFNFSRRTFKSDRE